MLGWLTEWKTILSATTNAVKTMDSRTVPSENIAQNISVSALKMHSKSEVSLDSIARRYTVVKGSGRSLQNE